MLHTDPRLSAPDSFAAALNLWPSISILAEDLHLPCSTVAAWRRRDSIPPGYWRLVVASAERRGLPDVTATLLEDLAVSQLQARRLRLEAAQTGSRPVIQTSHTKVTSSVGVAQGAQSSPKRKQPAS